MQITVYMKASCPYSRRAMRILEEKNVSFEAIDIAADPKKNDEMRERAHKTTTPQIFINGAHVGGCEDLIELERSGELDRMLGGGDQPAAP